MLCLGNLLCHFFQRLAASWQIGLEGIGVRRIGDNHDAGYLRKRGTDLASSCYIGFHLREMVMQSFKRGKNIGENCEDISSHARFPGDCFLDEVSRASKDTTGKPTQSFVERDVDGVGKRGDLGVRTAIKGGTFP